MHEKAFHHRRISFRFAILAALFAGLLGLLLLFLPAMDFVTFLLSGGAVGLLFAGRQYYSEHDQHLIRRSIQEAFLWLFLVTLAAYAVTVLRPGLPFLSQHWPALMAAGMCILTGLAGLRRIPSSLSFE